MSNKDKKTITNDLYNDPIKHRVYEPGLVMLQDFIERLEYDIQYNKSCLEQVKAHYKKFSEAFDEIEANGKSDESFIIHRRLSESIEEIHDFFAQRLPLKVKRRN